MNNIFALILIILSAVSFILGIGISFAVLQTSRSDLILISFLFLGISVISSYLVVRAGEQDVKMGDSAQ